MSNKKNDGKAHIYMKDGEVYVTIDGEVLSEFLKQFYANGLNIPRTILTEVEVADSQLISDWLETKKGEII